MNAHEDRRPPGVDPDGPGAGLGDAVWRRSSHSSGNGACVEVAVAGRVVAVRDSKDTGRPALLFSPRGWSAFLEAADDGRLHRR
ncbi:DUF397 domain-containing protein [Streptomyces sp. NPDC052016]|uniref:DUF397 domain-containing protein n=1 Tax=unclassified Streptomyces TaxID=2593676 RepID=UPI003448E0F2